MVDHVPDTTVVLGRILNDRHGTRSKAVLNEILNVRIRILFEVYLEAQSVIEKKAELVLSYVKNAFSEVAAGKGVSPTELTWDDVPSILKKARSSAHTMNDGFFNSLEEFMDFAKSMVLHPYRSLPSVYQKMIETNKDKIMSTFGVDKLEHILVSEETFEEDEIRNETESFLKKMNPGFSQQNRSRDLRIVCQLIACSKRAHGSTFNFIVIDKQLLDEMPFIIRSTKERFETRIGKITVQSA